MITCRAFRRGLKVRARPQVVFLFDCDNTLLDNDRVQADLRAHLDQRVWACPEPSATGGLYEALRGEVGYADYLGAMQRFRLGMESDPRILRLASFLLDYPFASRLYPRRARGARALPALGADGGAV